jgi:hypothetical protein
LASSGEDGHNLGVYVPTINSEFRVTIGEVVLHNEIKGLSQEHDYGDVVACVQSSLLGETTVDRTESFFNPRNTVH